MRVISFDPVIDENCISIFLGSAPGRESLNNKKYFHDRSNHFWNLVAYSFNEIDPGLYKERLQMLLKNKIALWDVLHECDRTFSRDNSIKNEKPNDLVELLQRYPDIKTLFVIGNRAKFYFHKYFNNAIDVRLIFLTSSSGRENESLTPALADEWESKIKANHGK